MSPTRRTGVHAPFTPSRGKRTREVEIRVEGGLHKGIPPQSVPPSYTPEARNFTPDVDGFITPRSGLSKFGSYNFGGAILGAAEVFDVDGRSCGFAPSMTSFAFLHPDNQIWSDLSYLPSNQTSMQGAPSGTSSDYYRTISVYDINTEQFIAVVSNNTDSVKFFPVTSTTTTFSDFSWLDSLDSTAKARDIASVNDRLVLFNTESSAGTRFVTRVLWSSRGDPKNYDIASEAGFEDLLSMRGEGQAIIRFRDFLLLFTEYEIWRATPTLDAYAFRFDRVIDNLGCPFPKTIAVTPHGVVFMEHDREIYITDGASVAPLGPVGGEGPSRIQRLLADDAINMARTWGIYSHVNNRYEIYFVKDDSTTGYPNHALFYDFSKRSWWPQTFPFGLSAAIDIYDPATILTYDENTSSYDSVALDYDSYDVAQLNRRVNVFTSDGSTLRYISTQTNDAGTAIDARWRSPGFRLPSNRQLHLTEIWMDYEAESASSVSIFVGAARDDTAFDSGKALSLTVGGDPIYVPTWKTGTAPNFEIRLNDGGQPKIASFTATLKEASKF